MNSQYRVKDTQFFELLKAMKSKSYHLPEELKEIIYIKHLTNNIPIEKTIKDDNLHGLKLLHRSASYTPSQKDIMLAINLNNTRITKFLLSIASNQTLKQVQDLNLLKTNILKGNLEMVKIMLENGIKITNL